MKKLEFDYSNSMIRDHELSYLREYVKSAHNMLHEKTGAGNDFLGWVDFRKTMTGMNLKGL